MNMERREGMWKLMSIAFRFNNACVEAKISFFKIDYHREEFPKH